MSNVLSNIDNTNTKEIKENVKKWREKVGVLLFRFQKRQIKKGGNFRLFCMFLEFNLIIHSHHHSRHHLHYYLHPHQDLDQTFQRSTLRF